MMIMIFETLSSGCWRDERIYCDFLTRELPRASSGFFDLMYDINFRDHSENKVFRADSQLRQMPWSAFEFEVAKAAAEALANF
jgi:hypothetical protein